MDNDKKCECCGTINDAHHSAECIDTGGKGYMRPQEPCEAVVCLNNWLDAKVLVTAYAYRVYHAATDTIAYELTLNKEEALRLDAYPIELKPTLLMR